MTILIQFSFKKLYLSKLYTNFVICHSFMVQVAKFPLSILILMQMCHWFCMLRLEIKKLSGPYWVPSSSKLSTGEAKRGKCLEAWCCLTYDFVVTKWGHRGILQPNGSASHPKILPQPQSGLSRGYQAKSVRNTFCRP